MTHLEDMFSPQSAILEEIREERKRQDAKWGEQNYKIGNDSKIYQPMADAAKKFYEIRAKEGTVTWVDVFNEEILEAMAEDDPKLVRAELIQTAAVVVAMIESLDRNELKVTP